jgi:hypothetical protein
MAYVCSREVIGDAMSCSEAQAWVIGDSMNVLRKEMVLGFRKLRCQVLFKVLRRISRFMKSLRPLGSRSEEIEMKQFLDVACATLPAASAKCDL